MTALTPERLAALRKLAAIDARRKAKPRIVKRRVPGAGWQIEQSR